MNTNDTQAQVSAEASPETHYFRFDVREFMSPLTPISVAEFNDGEESFFKRKEYRRVAGRDEHIEFYTSTFTSDKYLIILRTPPYRFIFYIPDDASLIAWKREYEQIPASLLAEKFLPPPPTPPNQVSMRMNMKALFHR